MLHQHTRAAVAIPLPKRFPKGMREQITEAIELHQRAMDGLIAILDLFDGDPDLEPSVAHGMGCTDLRMLDAEGDEHDGREFTWAETHGKGDQVRNSEDDEPSLAHTNDMDQLIAQRHTQSHNLKMPRGVSWAFGAGSDMEAEHDGREPQCEDEGAACEDEGAQCDDEGVSI